MKDAKYVSKKIFRGLGRRKVAICLFWFEFCLTGLRQLFVCGALSELKKNTPAPRHPHYLSTARDARFEF